MTIDEMIAEIKVLRERRREAFQAYSIAEHDHLGARERLKAALIAERGLAIGDEITTPQGGVRIVWFKMNADDELEAVVQPKTKDGMRWNQRTKFSVKLPRKAKP